MPEKKARGTLRTNAQGQEMTRKVRAVKTEAVPVALRRTVSAPV